MTENSQALHWTPASFLSRAMNWAARSASGGMSTKFHGFRGASANRHFLFDRYWISRRTTQCKSIFLCVCDRNDRKNEFAFSCVSIKQKRSSATWRPSKTHILFQIDMKYISADGERMNVKKWLQNFTFAYEITLAWTNDWFQEITFKTLYTIIIKSNLLRLHSLRVYVAIKHA